MSLLFASTINLVFNAIAQFIGSWAIPANENLYLTAGNQATCRTQGVVLLFTTYCVASYTSILSTYSYLAILNKFDESKLRRYEPFLHFVVIAWSLVMTTYAGIKNFLHPAGPFCFIANDPPGCRGKTCHHDDIRPYEFAVLVSLAILLLNATIMSVFIYILERRKGIANLSLHGKAQLREELKRKKIRAVMQQALLYVLSIYITYGITFFTRVLQIYNKPMPVPAAVFASIVISLQGTVNTIVYELTRSRKLIIIRSKKQNKERPNQDTIVFDNRQIIGVTNLPESNDTLSLNSDDCMTYSIFDGRRSSRISIEITFDDDLKLDLEGLERDTNIQHSEACKPEE